TSFGDALLAPCHGCLVSSSSEPEDTTDPIAGHGDPSTSKYRNFSKNTMGCGALHSGEV
ncbi:hypothetical protein SK128_018326, partial [Halocaridina rubra]